jgi:hypothetical protein
MSSCGNGRTRAVDGAEGELLDGEIGCLADYCRSAAEYARVS